MWIKHTLPFLPVFVRAAASLSHYSKRQICTAQSFNDPLVDDVPAINAVLQQCGDTGRILLPANTTSTLRSPLDLSSCRRCDFQINGLINISPDWDYWEKQSAAFLIPNSTAVIIRSESDTGVIDAQKFGWGGDAEKSNRVPKLFSVEKESYQIHIRDLKIRNAPGTIFRVSGNSTAVRFYGIDIETEAHTGYEVEEVRHVYLWNNTVRAKGACVKILPNSSNVQVEESTCIAAAANDESTPSGIELRFDGRSEGRGGGWAWIRNVLVKKMRAVGGMNIVAFMARGDGKVEIRNVTFTDISIEGIAKRAVYLEQGSAVWNVTEVKFNNFTGKAEEEADMKCKGENDVCDFKTEDWHIGYGR